MLILVPAFRCHPSANTGASAMKRQARHPNCDKSETEAMHSAMCRCPSTSNSYPFQPFHTATRAAQLAQKHRIAVRITDFHVMPSEFVSNTHE
jgi:hypothetical protein